MKRHPNVRKMQAAVDRWLEAASARVDGPELLKRRADWFADQIAALGREDLPTPAHLAGLTVWDLMDGQGRIEAAARSKAGLG